MSTTSVAPRTSALSEVPVLSLGFRPFFLGATLFAIAAIAAWTLVYTFSAPLSTGGLSIFQWHAHEMIYGYSLAVIAGFLLTAVSNWTGVRTVHGLPLLVLFGLWLSARVCMFFGGALIQAAALLDVLFIAGLVAAIAMPLVQTRRWKQLGILSKLCLIGAGNLIFYLGCFGLLESGAYWGIYGGLYLVIGLILVMSRRVLPSFIASGVGYRVTPWNSRWIDISNLLLFFLLFLFELFANGSRWMPYIAAALFALNGIRLVGWHTPGIWKTPLLWGLYTAYLFITLGFLLLALSGFLGISEFIAIHSFAYGGIGMMTVSMMIRVSLGHTGRNIHAPPRLATYALVGLSLGAVCRVLLPLLFPAHYGTWILISQIVWIACFAGVVTILLPMLCSPRVDGRAV